MYTLFTKMNLNQLGIRHKAIIDAFLTEEIPMKLLEIGLLPDTVVKIIQKAPFGGPLLIEFGKEKNRVAIRSEQASQIAIKSYH